MKSAVGRDERALEERAVPEAAIALEWKAVFKDKIENTGISPLTYFPLFLNLEKIHLKLGNVRSLMVLE